MLTQSGQYLRRIAHRVRDAFSRLIHSRATAHEIAFGFAIGAFVGVFPTFGLGFILIAVIAWFVRFNVPAAFLGTALGNPWFTPFWLAASLAVGHVLTGAEFHNMKDYRSLGYHELLELGWAYLLGNTLLSLATAAACYPAVRALINYRRARKARRHPH